MWECGRMPFMWVYRERSLRGWHLNKSLQIFLGQRNLVYEGLEARDKTVYLKKLSKFIRAKLWCQNHFYISDSCPGWWIMWRTDGSRRWGSDETGWQAIKIVKPKDSGSFEVEEMWIDWGLAIGWLSGEKSTRNLKNEEFSALFWFSYTLLL